MKKKSLNVKTINHKKITSFISDKKILNIYKKFEKNINSLKDKKIAAAISGGPDSLALVFLLKYYCLNRKISLFNFHIDHNLRENSKNEALDLKKKLRSFGIRIKILKWKGIKPNNNIQAIARNKRYELIFSYIKPKKIKYLILGHTYDDVIENFFIRMIRGSGLNGMISFNSVFRSLGSVVLVRPLINISKKDLIYLSKKVFNCYIEDTSNSDIKFLRVRVRKILKLLEIEGLNKKKLNLTFENLSISNIALEYYINKNIEENVIYYNKKKKAIVRKEFFNNPQEINMRAFSLVLRKIGNNYYSPRGKKVSFLIEQIKNNKLHKRTLSGCLVEKYHNSLLISREMKKLR